MCSIGIGGRYLVETRLEVRVRPRADRNRLTWDGVSAVRVYVTAPPEGGKANEAVITLIAKLLGVPRRDVELIRGQKSRDKVLRVEGLGSDAVLARLYTGKDTGAPFTKREHRKNGG